MQRSIAASITIAASIFLGAMDGAIAQPPVATSADKGVGKSDVSASASLAGVKKFEDATPADLSADATYVMPGFIDKDITLDNLRRRFGARNVREADLDGAEGEKAKGIVLFGNDAQRRAELFFADEERHRGVASIRVSGKNSRWHFPNGAHLGMTLDAIVALNGKAVSFNGLDWDYGGTITDWHQGKLAQRDDAPIFYTVSLNHDEAAPNAFPLGDSEFRSDDRRYPKQGSALYVGQLSASFNDPTSP